VGEHTVQFEANALPGKPFALSPVSYYGLDYVTEQVGAVARPLFFDYRVTVQDAHGNWIDSASAVEWAVTAGGGAVEERSSSYGYSGLFARHTLGPEPGLNTVVATVQGLPGQNEVTFNATAVDAAVAVLTDRFASDSIAMHVGQTVAWVWGTDDDPWYYYVPSEHDLVFEDTPAPPASISNMRMGAHTRTFAQPGTYRYRCTLHSTGFVSGHVGIVTVTDPRQH
jgi:plastocyanin